MPFDEIRANSHVNFFKSYCYLKNVVTSDIIDGANIRLDNNINLSTEVTINGGKSVPGGGTPMVPEFFDEGPNVWSVE